MNARYLRGGLERTGRFDIVSKDVGVPLVAFSLKDSSSYTVFNISESLRKYGWIVPAYTMPADAEHVAVLRVVIREDFSRSLAERLVNDMGKVLQSFDALPSHIAEKVAVVTAKVVDAAPDGEGTTEVIKSAIKTEGDISRYWKKLASSIKTSGVC